MTKITNTSIMVVTFMLRRPRLIGPISDTRNTNMKPTLVLVSALILLGLQAAAWCITGPTPGSEDVRTLYANSSVVCTGEVVRVEGFGQALIPAGSQSAHVYKETGTVLIRRFYKGGFQTDQIRVLFFKAADDLSTQLFLMQLKPGENILLFVKDSEEMPGTFEPVDNWFGKLPMSASLDSSVGDKLSGLDLLERDLEAGVHDPNPAMVRANLEVLGGLKFLHSIKPIEEAAENADSKVRTAAFLTLLKLSDYSYLRQTLTFMSLESTSNEERNTKTAMANAFERVKDSGTVPVLLEFSHSPSQIVRSSVVKALRQLNDPSSVPVLVSMLDDPDFYTRYDAAFTLATIEGKQNTDWINSLREYRRRESQYLQQWKDWWKTEGAQKYTGTAQQKQSWLYIPLSREL